MKYKLILIIMTSWYGLTAQVGAGFSITNDLYNVYTNPADGSGVSQKNGSALMTLGLGPKIWFGGDKFSLSVESQANISPLGLSLGDYKGLGAVSFPIMGKLNFNGLSGFNRLTSFGFTVGGGLQYNKTEIFGLTDEFVMAGVNRAYFKTYNIQVGAGMGLTGFSAQVFGRYGFNPDLDGARNFHLGIQCDFNLGELKKIHKPESAL